MTAVSEILVPDVPIAQIQGRMNRLWDPFARNSFIALVGVQGSGKSYLIRNAILPLCSRERIVVIDVKDGRDSAWYGFGKPATELEPAFFVSGDDDDDYPCAWRVLVDRKNAQAQLRKVFDQIRSEGHCVLVMDDSRSITEREQVGLGSTVENMITDGRALGISVIMGAQSSAWAVSAFKDQSGCLMIGQTRGQDQALALAKMAGYGRDLSPVINRIPAQRWLYSDQWEDEPILAMTGISAP